MHPNQTFLSWLILPLRSECEFLLAKLRASSLVNGFAWTPTAEYCGCREMKRILCTHICSDTSHLSRQLHAGLLRGPGNHSQSSLNCTWQSQELSDISLSPQPAPRWPCPYGPSHCYNTSGHNAASGCDRRGTPGLIPVK